MELEYKLKIYYITAILGVVFAAVGFSYNAWRLEVTEDNNNIRMAAFEVLKELAELEQIIYAAHYDKNEVEGNPRKGWVKVALILDLSSLIGTTVKGKAEELKTLWGKKWATMAQNRDSTDELVKSIEVVREEIKFTIRTLQ